MSNGNKLLHIFAFALAIVFSLFALSSVAFINHSCEGEHGECSICAFYENFNKAFISFIILTAVFSVATLVKLLFACYEFNYNLKSTPILLKVKLSD